ncbi:MAG: flagellar hook-length control protein FliK [Roseibium sp.]|uniref:flagellar hook-length control protein FliK n=1 Tax=Roseibium sp. TaxID=1936156 RepID=UPI00261DCDE6|nr:flagellar hook-length control protein FliK [Roseibium sp.]MCV0428233.1 flagellar hook-length control protein FliK [Roseibium sp.]
MSSTQGGNLAATQTPVHRLVSQLQQPLAEQQSGLGSLFAQIGSLATAQANGRTSLPDPVVKAMQQILGLRLNPSQTLAGKDLQQAVRMSGLFREAQIAQPPGGTSTTIPDLKSALLSFKALLQQLGAETSIARPANQPAHPTRQGAPRGQAQQRASGVWADSAQLNLQSLLRETDSALARMRLTQLVNAGLTADEGAQTSSRPMDLVLELPLALGQETAVLQMQIGRDGSGNNTEEDGEPAWRLRFAMDLTATGPLEAAISLRGGGTYASLWVDRKETFENLNSVRNTMEAAFADAGLDLQELRLIRGLPPKTAAKYGALIDRQS